MRSQAHPGKAIRFSAVVAITAALLCITFALIAVTGAGDGSDSVAHAAGTINVTTLTDEYDTTPNSTCSLREAIQSIIDDSSYGGCTNPGTADTVQLQAGTYTLTRLASGSTQTNSVGSLYVANWQAGDDFTVNILGVGSDQTIISTTASFDDRVFGFYDSSFNNTSSVAIEGVTIQGGNSSDYGGGILVAISSENASFSLTDAVIQNNRVGSSNYGGGLFLGSGTGNTTIERVTVYDNQAGYGGGIYYTDQYGEGQDGLVLTNVTIYSNTATFSGGGIYVDGSGGGITATNVTIAQNKAGVTGGNIYNNNTIVRLKNTIVADGISSDCAGSAGPQITSLGYNLDSDGTCGLIGTGDLSSTDPKLDSQLRYDGGSMETLALLEGSPALNQCADCPPIDQREWPRVTAGPCDIGAYERWVPELSLPLVLKNE